MKKMTLILLLSSGLANSNELNNLIDTSGEILQQLQIGVMSVGTALEYSAQGTALSDGTAHQMGYITSEQLDEYTNALNNMYFYMPYGDVKQVLEAKADEQLEIMHESVDVFTEAVVQMSTVATVHEMASEASTPKEEADVKEFVVSNQEVLTITQDTVDSYNQSAAQIEESANKASSFIAVANNAEAVEFLQSGAESNNTTAEQATVAYNANMQWVSMSWAGTNNATAVFLNGQNFGLDLYVTNADILAAGSESDFFTTSPVADSDCYYNQDC